MLTKFFKYIFSLIIVITVLSSAGWLAHPESQIDDARREVVNQWTSVYCRANAKCSKHEAGTGAKLFKASTISLMNQHIKLHGYGNLKALSGEWQILIRNYQDTLKYNYKESVDGLVFPSLDQVPLSHQVLKEVNVPAYYFSLLVIGVLGFFFFFRWLYWGLHMANNNTVIDGGSVRSGGDEHPESAGAEKNPVSLSQEDEKWLEEKFIYDDEDELKRKKEAFKNSVVASAMAQFEGEMQKLLNEVDAVSVTEQEGKLRHITKRAKKAAKKAAKQVIDARDSGLEPDAAGKPVLSSEPVVSPLIERIAGGILSSDTADNAKVSEGNDSQAAKPVKTDRFTAIMEKAQEGEQA